jgi:hypothetical protein
MIVTPSRFQIVMPAKAGIRPHYCCYAYPNILDSRFRGNDRIRNWHWETL